MHMGILIQVLSLRASLHTYSHKQAYKEQGVQPSLQNSSHIILPALYTHPSQPHDGRLKLAPSGSTLPLQLCHTDFLFPPFYTLQRRPFTHFPWLSQWAGGRPAYLGIYRHSNCRCGSTPTSNPSFQCTHRHQAGTSIYDKLFSPQNLSPPLQCGACPLAAL